MARSGITGGAHQLERLESIINTGITPPGKSREHPLSGVQQQVRDRQHRQIPERRQSNNDKGTTNIILNRFSHQPHSVREMVMVSGRRKTWPHNILYYSIRSLREHNSWQSNGVKITVKIYPGEKPNIKSEDIVL